MKGEEGRSEGEHVLSGCGKGRSSEKRKREEKERERTRPKSSPRRNPTFHQLPLHSLHIILPPRFSHKSLHTLHQINLPLVLPLGFPEPLFASSGDGFARRVFLKGSWWGREIPFERFEGLEDTTFPTLSVCEDVEGGVGFEEGGEGGGELAKGNDDARRVRRARLKRSLNEIGLTILGTES